MRTRDADILIIPGLGGSGPEHWQSRWQAKLPTARRIEQADWAHPSLAAWSGPIAQAIRDAVRPVVLVAHSLGVIASARVLLEIDCDRVAGAFLVSPPSETTVGGLPEIAPDFRPFPAVPLPCRTTLVASSDDPYCDIASAERLGASWGAVFVNAGAAGHINADSGHGPWPEGLMTFAGFLSKL